LRLRGSRWEALNLLSSRIQEEFSRAAIPTNSLVLMHKVAGRRINPLIWSMRAGITKSMDNRNAKPQNWITRYSRGTDQIELHYNKGTCHDEFDIEAVLDCCGEQGFHDLWISDLELRLDYRHNGSYIFVFKNQPLTGGTDAERWVMNYLRKLVTQGVTQRAQVRHLPLVNVQDSPRKHILSPEVTGDAGFIKWLGDQTFGLVKLKVVRRVDEKTFIDVRFSGE
jgi:hypothetical protein